MATRVETTDYGGVPLGRPRTRRRARRLSGVETTAVGWGAGLFAGIVMALPLILWDWVHARHLALELPMAATSWIFGLQHFSHTTYFVGSIVLGFVLLCAYWVVNGIVFTAIADRFLHARTAAQSLAAGAAWSVVSFLVFWNMILPINYGGAPFRAAADVPGLFTAPAWVFVLAFVAFGLASGAAYAVLRPPRRRVRVVEDADEIE